MNKKDGRLTHMVTWRTTPEQLRELANEIENDTPVTSVEITKDGNVEIIIINKNIKKR